jgi:hypothetical protein
VNRALTLILVILVAYAAMVSAHGPTRKKVALTEEIAAPPEKVWGLIANFQDMSWHPAIAKTEGNGGNEPGATRTLTLGNGGQIFEKLEKYDADKRSLFYRIEEVDVKVLPVTNYSSWLIVKPSDTGSQVTWKGAFYRGYPNNDPPPELSDQAAVDAVTAVYQSGLANLKALAEQAGE